MLCVSAVTPFAIGALEGPEEKGRQPRVFLQCSCCTVSSLRLGCSKDLLQSGPSDDLPHIGQEAALVWFGCLRVSTQRDLSFLSIYDL